MDEWSPDGVGMLREQGKRMACQAGFPAELCAIVMPWTGRCDEICQDRRDRRLHGRPVETFRTLHEARAWIVRQQLSPAKTSAPPATTWADPDPERHGTVIVGERKRDYTTREPVS